MNQDGLKYKNDPNGRWCDSGVFMETIPECTNLSAGFQMEHTHSEQQDIDHLEKLVDVCVKIDWDKLPTKRDPSVKKYSNSYSYGYYGEDYYEEYYHSRYHGNTHTVNRYDNNKKYTETNKDVFKKVKHIMSKGGYSCLNVNYFSEANDIYFQHFLTDDFVSVQIIDKKIWMNSKNDYQFFKYIGDYNDLNKLIKSATDEDDDSEYLKGERELYGNFIKDFPVNTNKVMLEMLAEKGTAVNNSTWQSIFYLFECYDKVPDDLKNLTTHITDNFIEWVYYNWEHVNFTVDKKIREGSVENTDTNTVKDENKVTFNNEQEEIFFDMANTWDTETLNQFQLDMQTYDIDTVMDIYSDDVSELINEYE